MNGPDHYRQAEAWLDVARDATQTTTREAAEAQAQVHATLALAAATVMGAARGPYAAESDEAKAWRRLAR